MKIRQNLQILLILGFVTKKFIPISLGSSVHRATPFFHQVALESNEAIMSGRCSC